MSSVTQVRADRFETECFRAVRNADFDADRVRSATYGRRRKELSLVRVDFEGYGCSRIGVLSEADDGDEPPVFGFAGIDRRPGSGQGDTVLVNLSVYPEV